MTPRRETAELAEGHLAATLAGGAHLSVTSLRANDVELLVAPERLPAGYRVHGRRAGITLLHPWANRLGATEFQAAGRRLHLSPDDPTLCHDPHGLPIHGLADPRGWRVEAESEASATAAAECPSMPAFPFPHRIEVRFELRPPWELHVATTLTAAEEPGVPIAFGWHPYFRARRSAASELRLPRLCHLQLDSCGLPTGRSDEQPATALPLHGRAFDDAFGGVAEGASLTLRTDDGLVEVRHEHGYPCAQIFAPIDAEVVSLEPMTAPVDALRSGEGLRLAPPGTPFTAGFTVRVAGPPPEPGL